MSKVFTGVPLKSPLKNKYNLLSTILKVSGLIENLEAFSAIPQAQYPLYCGVYFLGSYLKAVAFSLEAK
jgi:hypothetical protein